MDRICRLCLGFSKEKLNNIFQCKLKYSENSLVDVLFWIFSVEVDVTDPYPKDVCNDCKILIEYILEIKNGFQTNQKLLKNQSKDEVYKSIYQENNTELSQSRIQFSTPAIPFTIPINNSSKPKKTKKELNEVKLSIPTINALCPVAVEIERFEDSQEYSRYKPLGDGSFKSRKSRHFKLDETVLDEICNTLDYNEFESFSEKTVVNSKNLRKNEKKIFGHNEDNGSLPVLELSSLLGKNEDVKDDKYLDIKTKNTGSSRLSSNGDKEFHLENDWTSITFRKDASTNTNLECQNNYILPKTKSVGTNFKVITKTVGTTMKNEKNKNIVNINVESLRGFGPEVYLEPLKDILEKENYVQSSDFTFVRRRGDDDNYKRESESEYVEIEEQEHEVKRKDKTMLKQKQQKYLDYYKNFSSFAVRELIMGKKIRETDANDSPICKIASVCSVYVCDLCSKSFISQLSLNAHNRAAHKHYKQSQDKQLNDEERDGETQVSKMVFKKRRRKIYSKRIKKDVLRKIESTKSLSEHVSNNKHKKAIKIPKKRFENHLRNVKRRELWKMQSELKRKNLGKLLKDGVLAKEKNKLSYVWDRKKLGIYSAISYYRNQARSMEDHQNEAKTQSSLQQTIRKLANRLDSTEEIDVNDIIGCSGV